MYIESLELSGYRRLVLNNIQHLVLTPTSPYQLILGTNGSGKSSVLEELSPLPAHSSNYTKDGFKKIVIRHQNRHYVMTSTFKSGGKHSMLRDDEELNPGGTASVQKELVKREFGLWPDLHELMTGKLKFTEMSSQQRRDWISLLSTMDYTYALGVFNKVKSAARDRQAITKHLKSRLTQETANVQLIENVAELTERRDQIMTELNALLAARTPNLASYNSISMNIEQTLQRIEEQGKLLQRYYRSQPQGYRFHCVEDVDAEVQAMEGMLVGMREILARVTKEHQEMDEMARRLAVDEEEIPVNLYETIEQLQDDLLRDRKKLRQFADIQDAELVLRDNEAILDDVMALFRTLPDNSDRHLSKQRAEETREQIRYHQDLIEKSANTMSKINRHLVMMRSAQTNECPSCNYKWRPGYSDVEITQNETWLTEHQALIDAAQARLKELQSFLERIEEYAAQCQQFRGYVIGYPRLKPLWDHVLQEKILTDNPGERSGVFIQWQRDTRELAEQQLKEKRLQRLEEIATRQQQGGSVVIIERLHQLYRSIEEMTFNIRRLTERKNELASYRSCVHNYVQTVHHVVEDRKRLEVLAEQGRASLRNQFIDQTVQQHQMELGNIQQRLSTNDTLKGIVTDLQGSLDIASVEHEALNLLTRALSPVDGLIAEQMIGFISCLVAQMNSMIGSIWTKDFTVLACGLDSGELDYKFPAISGPGLRITDVKDGSTAQKEVVNFAFMLTVMLYLNLKDYPLFLDELGAGFDEQHRINVMQFVKQLMDLKQHSQMFMISHYVGSWGVFVGAQHLVLDGSNIAVPDGHNQHAVLT